MTVLPAPEWPDGLPVGDEWVAVEQTAEILQPCTGKRVAVAPVGSAPLVGQAISYAVKLREPVGSLPSRVRRVLPQGPRCAIDELTVTRMAIIRPTTRQAGT